MNFTILSWILLFANTLLVCYCGDVAAADAVRYLGDLKNEGEVMPGNRTLQKKTPSSSPPPPTPTPTPTPKDKRGCSSYHKYTNTSNRCTYVKALPRCHFDDGYLAYIQFVHCTFSSDKYRPAAYVLLGFWLLFLFVTLGVTAEDYFCPCLKSISKTLRMSDSLAGVTLLALGNGAPDIFSVIAAINNKNPRTAELAFQELFGAGIFVTTVVAGSVNIFATFKMARRPFLRDNVFYLAAVTWTFIVMYRREIHTSEAIGFIVLYVLYVSIVIVGQCVNRRLRSVPKLKRLETLTDDDQASLSQTPSPDARTTNSLSPPHPQHRGIRDINESADFSSFDYSADVAHLFKENRHSEAMNGTNFRYSHMDDSMQPQFFQPTDFVEKFTGINKVNWNCQSVPSKIFTIIKIPIVFALAITCPVVDYDVRGQKWDKWVTIWHCIVSPLFVTFTLGFGTKEVHDEFLVYHVVVIFGALLALLVYFVTSPLRTPRFHSIFALLGFLVAVMWIRLTAQEVVNLLETVGWITGLSYGIMGLTFLAWGNSIGDFISNLTMAKNGAPRMAIAACYGGPLLNMLIGVGISCTLSALKNHGHKMLIRGKTQYILSTIFLAVSLLSAITILPMNRFISSRYIGIYLLLLYSCYLLISVLHEIGFVNIK